MIPEEIRYSLIKADRVLSQAETELNRPHEDVVTLSACQSVRNSMKEMMRLYLLAHAVNSDNNGTLESLLQSCIKVNQQFSAVDIERIECKGLGHQACDNKYCLSIENVSSCLTAAQQLKSLIWSEFKIN